MIEYLVIEEVVLRFLNKSLHESASVSYNNVSMMKNLQASEKARDYLYYLGNYQFLKHDSTFT